MTDAIQRLRAATFYPVESRMQGAMRSDDALVSVRVGDLRAVLEALKRRDTL